MNIQPPWLKNTARGKVFSVAGVENVPDLHGDIVDPQLTIFFNGNQFMVVNELRNAFQKRFPQYKRIFIETLPPGILVEQIRQGTLIIGNMRIKHQPDVLTAGQGLIKKLQQKEGWFERYQVYARNDLAIMVQTGNPKRIQNLSDLGGDDVRVSMPDPIIEGIGKLIKKALKKAGGQALVAKVMKEKVSTGSTFLTQIHHRQTPLRIMQNESDAGVTWRTEVLFQRQIKNPIAMVEIPPEYNQTGVYWAAQLKNAPHPQAATDFLDFLTGIEGQKVYQKFGFLASTD